ncbi:MAG: endonuclease III [Desulfobacterales bacterium]|jgi:endonuclease-3|nr:endonuclease III [Desulfobacterales bacterium]MDP6683194.1 endonuclease III [Desulfobacterales bacterium]MDP6806385.1 endonuclease III [Desulfobacterales bacterium]MDP7354675.1 endonuclease III [Desulfobacterales bacterium]HJO62724.1 endonuclease III [Desulfobacterales bacterium]
MLEDKVRAGKVRKRLRLTYPEVTTQLHYRTSFELLVATILSAQCTDKQVNSVTRGLFKKFNAPKDFTKIPLESLEQLVRATGFFRNKAKNIKACAQALVEKYHGKVPETLEELVLLPGVGRKTANLVLGAAFGIPGIVVDTHVIRISKRLGFTESKDPAKIERDLMKIIPKMAWSDFSLHLVYFGREFCTARKPRCKMCPLIKLCPWPDKNL